MEQRVSDEQRDEYEELVRMDASHLAAEVVAGRAEIARLRATLRVIANSLVPDHITDLAWCALRPQPAEKAPERK